MKVQSIIKALLLNIVLLIAINAAAQNVGINTTAPLRSFHIKSGSLLITGDTGTVPNLGAGAKFFWSPAKSAFRAGNTTGKEWDYDSLGMYSFAYGRGTKANGGFSMAGGNYSSASKQSSFSFGNQVQVSGDYSAGFGSLNSITGTHSFTAGGDNDATGNYSVAFGRGSTANAYGSLVIGRWNKIEDGASSTAWVATDPAFVIGNGSSNATNRRSNAFSVAKNGDMEVVGKANMAGDVTIAGTTNITGDLEVFGATDINGLLKLHQKNIYRPSCDSIFTVIVGNASYIRLTSVFGCIKTIRLSDGLEYGQLLIINVAGERVFFSDSQDYNMALTSSHSLSTGSTITFIWTGAIWNQIAVSDIN